MGLPGGSAGKESTCNVGDLGSSPWVGKIPWRKEPLLIPVFWPGEFHGLYSPWGCKELDMTEQLSFQVRDNVGLSDPAGSSRSGQKIKDNIGSVYYVKFI